MTASELHRRPVQRHSAMESREPGLSGLWQGGEAPPHSDAPPPASPGPAPLARRTNSGFRWLRRKMGSADGAGERLVLDRARGICHGACAAWRRANAQEYARRGAPTGASAERSAAGQLHIAGRRAGRAVGSTVGAVGCNCQKDGRTKPTHTSQMASIAQVAARRKKGVPFPR